MDDFEDGFKKILYAGIGAAAATGEKAQQLFNDLADRGADFVQKNNLDEKFQKKAAEASDAAKAVYQKVTETQRTRREVAQTLAGMTDEQIRQLKKALDGLGFSKPEEDKKAAGDQTQKPEEKTEPQEDAADESAAEEKAGDAPQESDDKES